MEKRIAPRERTAILQSLAAGVVPRVGLQHIQVGRKAEVTALLQDLARIEEGGATIRFVVGRFGAGKSFFLNLVQMVALERKFIILRADITTQRRLHATGGEARALYTELMRNLATRSRPEGGGLSSVIEKWVSEIEHEVTARGGNEQDVEAELSRRCQPLQELVGGFDFVQVLRAYYRGHVQHDDNLQSAALRWLRGEYSTKTEARQELGIRNIIDDESYYDYLKLFSAWATGAGYKGVLVCLDELVVLSHRLNNRLARNNNYETILKILNDCLQGEVGGLGFIFAATDECLSDTRRGLFSYEALASRLATNRFAAQGLVDLQGPVLQLQSLTPEDCFVLLHNIRRVHTGADSTRQLLPDEAIEAYLQSCATRMGAAYYQTPRDTTKDFVGLLNVLEQNPQINWRALLGEIKTSAADIQTEDPALLQTSSNGTGPMDDDDLSSFKL
jgi:hypothetical protein